MDHKAINKARKDEQLRSKNTALALAMEEAKKKAAAKKKPAPKKKADEPVQG